MSEVMNIPEQKTRLQSLDVFRGITIAGMLLVNNAGDWGHILKPLEHAEWHGITATDIIFPFFLFIMGVAMTFSFAKRAGSGASKSDLHIQIIRRTIILSVLNLILNSTAGWAYLGHYRFYGVLQRIAFCYFIVSFVLLYSKLSYQIALTFFTLAIYYIILKIVPYPDGIPGNLNQFHNIVDYIDNTIMHRYLYDIKDNLGHDPEGLISTLGAVASTLTGAICGHWLRLKDKSGLEKVAGMSVAGTLLLIISNNIVYDMPFNKNLWTPSYVLHTTGWALLCLSVCYWFIDIKGYDKWSKPFLYYGTNAIAAYFGASMFGLILVGIKLNPQLRVKTLIYNTCFKSWIEPIFGPYICSASYGMMFVVLFCFLTYILYKKKIFIKV